MTHPFWRHYREEDLSNLHLAPCSLLGEPLLCNAHSGQMAAISSLQKQVPDCITKVVLLIWVHRKGARAPPVNTF